MVAHIKEVVAQYE